MTNSVAAQTPKKRKPHRRGQSQVLGPSGAHRSSVKDSEPSSRQCIVCRKTQAIDELLQLADRASKPASRTKRHTYVCIARPCMEGLEKRALSSEGACAPLRQQFVDLATRRVIETIGLARRQGLVVMGAARIVALRAEYHQDWVAPEGSPSRSKFRDGAHTGPVILVSLDAATRAVRQMGAQALPSMLTSAQMGHAAGGAPVAAVGITGGRLALRAAYWMQVWYEARLADHTRADD